MIKRLYDIQKSKDGSVNDLYIKTGSDILDFCTYFNIFSISKWRKYTELNKLTISLDLTGKFEITFWEFAKNKRTELLREKCDGHYKKCFLLSELQKDTVLLGFTLKKLGEDAVFDGGGYFGEFNNVSNMKLGIVICTYKREEYVKRNIDIIKECIKDNPNISLFVADNGATLQEYEEGNIRIAHNKNYGGSGGFTRGMIEYTKSLTDGYVLLMDDDVKIEISTIQRLYSFGSSIKNKYKDSMIGGAMLDMDFPLLQIERTAEWHGIKIHANGKHSDLTEMNTLINNEMIPWCYYTYTAWWFCAIPLHRIREIGYPLPIFVKGDDIEYDIRNRKEIITFNGLSVWHEGFRKKKGNAVNSYYLSRNMFILLHYIEGCGRMTFLLSMFLRWGRNVLLSLKNRKHIAMFYLALVDYGGGFEKILSLMPDENHKRLNAYQSNFNWLFMVIKSLLLGFKIGMHFEKLDKSYKAFYRENLLDSSYWEKILK